MAADDKKQTRIGSDRLARSRFGSRMAPSQDDNDSWTTTYMDVVTLLLATFIVILSFANFEDAGQPKASAMADLTEASALKLGALFDAGRFDDSLKALQAELEDNLELPKVYDAEIVREGASLAIHLPGSVLFESGESDLSERGRVAIDLVVPQLKDLGYAISIEGHTDDLPVTGGPYPSNWELGSARAGTVVRYLAFRGLDPTQLRAIGYADTKPLVPNYDAESRARNRRVTILVHPTETFP